jgi:MFS family permease
MTGVDDARPTARVETPAKHEQRDTRTTITLAVLTMTALVFSMLQSLVIPALTTIQRDLDASETETTWIVTSLFLTSAVATPIVGRLGDIYGRSRMLLFSFGCLIVGTTVGALSQSIELLIVARGVQGLAGGLIPLAFGIVRDVMPARRVASAIGAISAMLAVGAATGIVLSGPIVTRLGYRWLFWIPLFVIVPAALLSWRVIPQSRRSKHEPVDLIGAFLLSAWLVTLLFGVTQGASWGWTSAGTIALFGISAVTFVVWIVVELHMPVPLIDIRLMSRPTLLRINIVGFTTGLSMQAMFTFVPRFVQIPEVDGFGLGVSASNAGLIVLPWSIGAFVTGTLAGRVALRFGLKAPLVAGCLLSVIPGLMLAVANDRLLYIGIALGIFGTGTGLVAAAMPTMIVMFAPEHQVGVAAGMNQNIRTIGGAIGAQTIGAIIASSIGDDGRATEGAYQLSFVVIAMVCVLATIAAITVPSRPREHRAG